MSGRRDLAAGLGVFALAVLIALAMHAGAARYAAVPERAVAVAGIIGIAAVALMLVAWVAVRRRALSLPELSLAALTAAAVMLCGIYLYWAAPAVFHRADILLWSESSFVNDIIKLRTGHAMFGPPADLDAFTYPPLPSLLTYALASLAGKGTSIPAYRVIQLLYTAAATLLAVRATRRLTELTGIAPRRGPDWLWGALWTAVLFLVAGNALTNPFSHLLHDDALALLVSSAAFLLLVEYAATRSVGALVGLAILPAPGFAVKQSLAIWAGLLAGYLVVFDRPRDLKRIVLATAAAFGLVGLLYAGGLLLWGENFTYWLVTVLKHHTVSPLRSVQHVLEGWIFFACGIAGGLVVLARRTDDRLLGVWVVWLLFLGIEAYTSGVAYMINHLGPGSLLALTWLCAAAPAAWPAGDDATWRVPSTWLRPLGAAAIGALLLSGLGAVRVPMPALPADIERYTAAIEAEMRGMDPATVMIDHGSWLYIRPGVVMKDRMAAAGEAGYTGTGDFSGLLQRVRTHYYARILVHNLESPTFQYDHEDWPRSSGIRQALLESYRVVRTIPGVEGLTSPWYRPISVLEPRADTATMARD